MPSTCAATVALAPLRGRVRCRIDTSGTTPRLVADSARLLAPSCATTRSSPASPSTTRTAVPLADRRAGRQHPGRHIGDHRDQLRAAEALRARCRARVRRPHARRAAGRSWGPTIPPTASPTGRRRIADGGTVLAGHPGARTQIDARPGRLDGDDGRGRRSRAFNAVGPAEPLTIGALLDRCFPSPGQYRHHWAETGALLDREVEPRRPAAVAGRRSDGVDGVDGPRRWRPDSPRPTDETIAGAGLAPCQPHAPGRAGCMSREQGGTAGGAGLSGLAGVPSADGAAQLERQRE
jgi:hypothetical protein